MTIETNNSSYPEPMHGNAQCDVLIVPVTCIVFLGPIKLSVDKESSAVLYQFNSISKNS